MGMSTHIVAFVPDTDPDYQKHLKIWNVCREAGVSLPKETEEYFEHCGDPEYKLQVNLSEGVHYHNYHDIGAQGFEVDLTQLPKGVTKIRFYNSW